MNWTRYKVLIIGGVISLALIGVGVYFMIAANGEARDQEMEISSLESRKSSLTKAKILPTQSNFNQMKLNEEALSERIEGFEKAITASQVQPVEMDPAGFGDYVNGRLGQLRQKASENKAGGEEGVILRDTSFQMQDYQDGVPPRPIDVARLMIQVQYVFHLAETLCDAGISELISIERKVFEGESVVSLSDDEDPDMEAMLERERRSMQDEEEELTEEELTRKRIGELFESEAFTLKFRAYEHTVWDLLNRLAADQNQIVIRNVEISSGNRQLWPIYQKPSEGISPLVGSEPKKKEERRTRRSRSRDLFAGIGGDPERTSEEAQDVKSVPMVGLTNRRQKETGGELMEVVIDLSVYRLKTETSSTEEES